MTQMKRKSKHAKPATNTTSKTDQINQAKSRSKKHIKIGTTGTSFDQATCKLLVRGLKDLGLDPKCRRYWHFLGRVYVHSQAHDINLCLLNDLVRATTWHAFVDLDARSIALKYFGAPDKSFERDYGQLLNTLGMERLHALTVAGKERVKENTRIKYLKTARLIGFDILRALFTVEPRLDPCVMDWLQAKCRQTLGHLSSASHKAIAAFLFAVDATLASYRFRSKIGRTVYIAWENYAKSLMADQNYVVRLIKNARAVAFHHLRQEKDQAHLPREIAALLETSLPDSDIFPWDSEGNPVLSLEHDTPDHELKPIPHHIKIRHDIDMGNLVCPLTGKVYHDPVLFQDAISTQSSLTFERSAIEAWLAKPLAEQASAVFIQRLPPLYNRSQLIPDRHTRTRLLTHLRDPTNDAFLEMCPVCQADSLERKLFPCSKCERVYYCGEACQRVHWKEHSSHCRMH